MALDSPHTAMPSSLRVLSERSVPSPTPPPLSFPSLADDHQTDQQPRSTTSGPTSTPLPQVYPQAMLAAFDVIAKVLAARLILLLSVFGAFALAYLATTNPSNLTLAMAGIYNLTVVAPLIWLTAMRV